MFCLEFVRAVFSDLVVALWHGIFRQICEFVSSRLKLNFFCNTTDSFRSFKFFTALKYYLRNYARGGYRAFCLRKGLCICYTRIRIVGFLHFWWFMPYSSRTHFSQSTVPWVTSFGALSFISQLLFLRSVRRTLRELCSGVDCSIYSLALRTAFSIWELFWMNRGWSKLS